MCNPCVNPKPDVTSDKPIRATCKVLSYLAANYDGYSDVNHAYFKGHDYSYGTPRGSEDIPCAPQSDP